MLKSSWEHSSDVGFVSQNQMKTQATDKIKRFYNILMLSLFVLAAALFFAWNFSPT
jgi:hypothetical protein